MRASRVLRLMASLSAALALAVQVSCAPGPADRAALGGVTPIPCRSDVDCPRTCCLRRAGPEEGVCARYASQCTSTCTSDAACPGSCCMNGRCAAEPSVCPLITTPPMLGTSPDAPLLIGPGMGWVAYVDLTKDLEPLRGPVGIESLHMKMAQVNREGRGVNLLYVRVSLAYFEANKDLLHALVQAVEQYNAKPRLDGTRRSFAERFRVMMRVMFTDDCNGDIKDYPAQVGGVNIEDICSPCPNGACEPAPIAPPCGTISTPDKAPLIDYCGSEWECANNSGQGPYCTEFQVRVLNYLSDNATLILQAMNLSVGDFVRAHPGMIQAVDAGFVDNWGENALLMYKEYGRPPRADKDAWDSVAARLDAWYADFRQQIPQSVEALFDINVWLGLVPDQPLSDARARQVFDIASRHGYGLRRDGGDDFTMQIICGKGQSCEAGRQYIELQKERVIEGGGRPFFREWEPSVEEDVAVNPAPLDDEFEAYPTYMQAHMSFKGTDIPQWGIKAAIRSLDSPIFLRVKNLLGYRYAIRRAQLLNAAPGTELRLQLVNVARGFGTHPIRLTALDGQGASLGVAALDAQQARQLMPCDSRACDALDASILLGAQVPSGTTLKVRLEVRDRVSGQYVPTGWSNQGTSGEAGSELVLLTVP